MLQFPCLISLPTAESLEKSLEIFGAHLLPILIHSSERSSFRVQVSPKFAPGGNFQKSLSCRKTWSKTLEIAEFLEVRWGNLFSDLTFLEFLVSQSTFLPPCPCQISYLTPTSEFFHPCHSLPKGKILARGGGTRGPFFSFPPWCVAFLRPRRFQSAGILTRTNRMELPTIHIIRRWGQR